MKIAGLHHNLVACELLVSVCLSLIFVSTSLKYCIERRQDCDGPDSECSRTVPCHHGECDETRQLCLCEGCWAGKNCNQYVDEHEPRFLSTTEYVTYDIENSGIVVFTATAFDRDQAEACHGVEQPTDCPCGHVRYHLMAGYDEELFQLDVDTGRVFVTPQRGLNPGVEYVLVIGASNVGQTNGTNHMVERSHHDISSGQNSDTLKVRIHVRSKSDHQQKNDDDERKALQLSRSKRAAADATDTILNLSQVSTSEPTDTTHAKVGDGKNFMMTIEVPAGVSMDINVEIFTVDPTSNQTAFVICNTQSSFGNRIQPASLGDVKPQLFPSLEYPKLNNRVLFDFGVVTAPADATQDSDRTISLAFSAHLVYNDPYVVDGGTYSVVVGASYDNGANVWIGQAPFTADLPPPEDSNTYSSAVLLEGPSVAGVAGYAMFTLTLNSSNPMASYQVDVFGVDAPPDSYSAGPIILLSVADNYPCNLDGLLDYAYELVPSDSGKTAKTSTLKTSPMINCGSSGRTNSTHEGNQMVFRFLVYIPDDDTLEGSVLPIIATVMINKIIIWANIVNVTVTTKQMQSGESPTLSSGNSTVVGTVMSTITIQVDIVQPSAWSEVTVEVSAPENAENPAPLSVCGYSTSTAGVNIPFSMFNSEPELTARNTGGQINDFMLITLGRIWSAPMVPGNTSASSITVTVFLRIEDASADGKVVQLRLLRATGSWVFDIMKFTVNVGGQPPPEIATDVDIQLMDILNQTSISVEGDAAIQATMSFNAELLVNTMTLEVISALNNETVQARVCRAEVTFVGIDMPCVRKQIINQNVDYRIRTPDSDVYDMATLRLGTVCISKSLNKSDVDQMVMSFAVELYDQATAIDGALYTLYSGVKMGNEMIWTGSMTYTVKTAQTATFNGADLPVANGFLSPTASAFPDSTVLVFIRLKIPPMSRASYVLTMSTSSGKNLGICRVTFSRVGHNFPCVDSDPQPGNVSRAATTRIEYDQMDATMGVYSKAILDFGPLSNLGSTVYNVRPEDDDNSMTVAVAVKLDKAATGTLPLAYTVTYTSQGAPIAGSVLIPINTTGTVRKDIFHNVLPTFQQPNMTFEALNETRNDIHVNLTKILIFRFQAPEGASSPVTVKFQNANADSKNLGFCSASVTKVGKNMPCINSLSIIAKSNDTIPTNCMSTLIMDLGSVCYANLSQDPTEDWMTIEVGMNIIDQTLSGTVTVKATLIAGTSEYDADALTLSVDNTPPTLSPKNLTLTPLTNQSIPVFVGVRTWIDMNVTIPEGCLSTMKLTAIGESFGKRAVITINAVKVSAGGVNVACIKNTTDQNTDLRTSTAIQTNQKDIVSVDFGYVGNTGFTYRRGHQQDFDDQVTVSVEVTMTDHPLADEGAEFQLKFVVENEAGIYEANQTLIVNRNGTEKPEVEVIAEVINPELEYGPQEIVSVRLLLSHKLTPPAVTSTAEPIDTDVRLYLPSFMRFTPGSAVANVTVVESTFNGGGGSDVDIVPVLLMPDPFLFDDIREVNFTLTVDPLNERGFDAPTIDVSSLVRVVAHVRQRNVEGAMYPSVASDQLNASESICVWYTISGSACKQPLGMKNHIIKDCQLSASTMTDADHDPSKARLMNPPGIVWRPALRNNFYKDYLQVDFGNRTKVAEIAIDKDSCCRAPTAITVQYSDDGSRFKDLQIVSSVTYNGSSANVHLDVPLAARMMRIVLDELDEPENKDTKYVGIRLEFYGCPAPLGEFVQQKDICSTPTMTIDSTDATSYRHFLVADQTNAVFACDLKTTWDLRCFCSADGSKWTLLPHFISRIAGYDGAQGRTYVTDPTFTTLMKSDDCSKWLSATRIEFEQAKASVLFKESSVVAGLAKDDPSMVKTIGRWTAKYDGLYLDNTKKVGWSQ